MAAAKPLGRHLPEIIPGASIPRWQQSGVSLVCALLSWALVVPRLWLFRLCGPPQVLMWQEGCGSLGAALLRSTAQRFPFLQEQPLPGHRLHPWGLKTAGLPAVGPASRLKPGGGFQQESGARNTLSQHPPDSSRFPPPPGLSLPDL